MQIRVLTSKEVRLALPMAEAIEAMKAAFGQLSAGNADVPLRIQIDADDGGGISLFMPALLSETDDLAIKVVSVFPENLALRIPTIHALVVVLDPKTGRPIALIEGGTLTAIRTGAGSGAATDLLAKPNAKRAAILGAGVQARTQLEAVCAVRDIESVCIYSLEHDRSQMFVSEIASQPWAPSSIDVASSPTGAIEGADVICTATTSSKPVFSGAELKPGTHINAIGSFTPTMQEVDNETIKRSMVVVDSRSASLEESGDLIIPIHDGSIAEGHIHAELGEIVNGAMPGRTDPDQITFYKSVGVAVQDAAAAGLALRNAERLGLGQVIEL